MHSCDIGMFKDFLERNPDEFAYGHRERDLAYSADLFYFPIKRNYNGLSDQLWNGWEK